MGSRREHGESDEGNNGAAAQEDERERSVRVGEG
jgi:hypothetical protein